jgi:DNA-3-methyladenine glycosylase I
MVDSKKRCGWVVEDRLCVQYHDEEWGVPVHNDHKQFECLLLEGAQAGLSWLTILKRREEYKRVFRNFDPNKVALFTDDDIRLSLRDAGIIRNRLKLLAAVNNAQIFLLIQAEFGSFSKYIRSLIGEKVTVNHWKLLEEVPSSTEDSVIFSKDLKKRGMKFVGPTIMYAYMQATGLVNDHTIDCFRYNEV